VQKRRRFAIVSNCCLSLLPFAELTYQQCQSGPKNLFLPFINWPFAHVLKVSDDEPDPRALQLKLLHFFHYEVETWKNTALWGENFGW
jgi:hypothetical protein